MHNKLNSEERLRAVEAKDEVEDNSSNVKEKLISDNEEVNDEKGTIQPKDVELSIDTITHSSAVKISLDNTSCEGEKEWTDRESVNSDNSVEVSEQSYKVIILSDDESEEAIMSDEGEEKNLKVERQIILKVNH